MVVELSKLTDSMSFQVPNHYPTNSVGLLFCFEKDRLRSACEVNFSKHDRNVHCLQGCKRPRRAYSLVLRNVLEGPSVSGDSNNNSGMVEGGAF